MKNYIITLSDGRKVSVNATSKKGALRQYDKMCIDSLFVEGETLFGQITSIKHR